MNLVELLRATAARQPDRPALTDVARGRSLSYAALLGEVEASGKALGAAGVRAPQRIALVGDDGVDYVAAAFAILAAGGCLVPIAAQLRASEAAAIVDGIDVNGVVRLCGDGRTWRFAWHDRERPAPDGFADLDAAFVRFTSGTTAAAKGVILSHRATIERIRAADAVLGLGREDRVLWTLPLAYHFAVTIPAYLGAGAHVLLCAEHQPAKLVAALAAQAATLLYAAPVQLERLAAVPGAPRLPALRRALSTAAPLSPETAARFATVFGTELGQAYGIIEAGLACINDRTDPRLAPTSVGPPVPGYDVAIAGEEGAQLGPGAQGEVLVRGPGLFDGYYTPWTPRAAALRNGWLATGDVGALDSTGALTLLGRRKSTIVVAGLKFFPEEVEACLATFPGVAEARVFPRPHPRLGELPYADVVLSPGVRALDRAAIDAHCARHLSPYKVPVDFTVVGAVARTPGGKLLRR